MFALIFLTALFLILLVALSFASVKLLGTRDAKGELTAPGCLNGCAMAIVLATLGCVGTAAFVAGAMAFSTARSFRDATRDLPEMKVGVWSDPQAFIHHQDGYPLHVVLQWKGESEPTEKLLHGLEDQGLGESAIVTWDHLKDDSGETLTVVDIALPAGAHDLKEIEKAVRQFLPEYNLSEGIEVTLRSVHDESANDANSHEESDEDDEEHAEHEDHELR